MDPSILNEGFIGIQNYNSDQDHEAMDLGGTFTNKVGGSISVNNISFTSVNLSNVDKEAIKVRPTGILSNDGDIIIDEIDGHAILVSGELLNKTNGRIFLGDSIRYAGIYCDLGTGTIYFNNYGEIRSTINESSLSKTIVIKENVEANNHGLIRIENSTSSIKSIVHNSDFNNTLFGRIEIYESSGIQIGEGTGGVVSFINDGNINLSHTINPIGTAISIKNGGTFLNNSIAYINGYQVGLSTQVAGNLVTTEGSTLSIINVDLSAINNSGEISNSGKIRINGCDNECFRNLYIVTNFESGEIEILNTGEISVRNAGLSISDPLAYWRNYGTLDIAGEDGGVAIYNWVDATFEDRGRISVSTNSSILNLSNFLVTDTVYAPLFISNSYLDLLPPSRQKVFTGDVELRGVTDFSISSRFSADKIKAEGNLHLDGEIHIDFSNNYVPSQTEDILMLECGGTRSGFIENLTSSAALLSHTLNYRKQNEVVLDYNLCGSNSVVNQFMFPSGNWNTSSNWSLGHVPYPCEEVVITSFGDDPTIVNMNSSNAVISKLQMNGHVELIIQSSKMLTINMNFNGGTPEEALFVSENAKITNQGTLEILNINSSEFVENQGFIENHGIINMENGYGDGTRGIFNPGSIQNNVNGWIGVSNLDIISGGDIFALQNHGSYIENGQSEFSYNTYNNSEGMISGFGILSAPDVYNDGILSPGNSIGALTIDGNLTQLSNSIISMEVDGIEGPGQANGHDRLIVTQDFEAGGNLKILPSFIAPLPTHEFRLIQYQGSKTGEFDQIAKSGDFSAWELVDDGLGEYILMYHADCIHKTVSWVGRGMDNNWMTGANWSPKLIPKGCHEVVISRNQSVVVSPDEEIEAATISLSQSTLELGFRSNMTLYEAEPSVATIKLIFSQLTNNGTMRIQGSTNGNPMIMLDETSSLKNNLQIIIQ